jgi:hypothetical protein
MSDFFANVGGFRMPDVRMNQGPLPSVVGGPAGTDGTPDGVINGTNSLLSGITPYAYGEAARMGSDRNYQQIPHRVQYIIPPLHLPSFDSTTTHRVCHVVDNGDLAFTLMTRGRQWFGAGETVMSVGPGTLPVFGNLDVVNYVLACLQIAPTQVGANARGAGAGGKRSWTKIREHLWDGFFDETSWADEDRYEMHMFQCVMYTVQHMLKPHGICAGSEHQGGQHEESWAPVQAAVNYTTTMTVDGQNRDLVNYWHEKGVFAGDRLILRLVRVGRLEREATREFQLTSYYERPVSAPVTTNKAYWQLQPWILNEDMEKPVDRYDYRVTGYWHIAQSFQGRQGSGVRHRVPQGAPLQVTFAPVFVRNGAEDDAEWDWVDLLDTMRSDKLQIMAEYRRTQQPRRFLGNFATLVESLQLEHVKIVTIERTIGGDFWRGVTDEHRLILFATIIRAYHYAKDIGSAGLQRRVVRMIRGLEERAAQWGGMSGDAVAIDVDDFLRTLLGGRLEAFLEWIDNGRAAVVTNDVARARQNPGAAVPDWVYHNLDASLGDAVGGGAVGGGAVGGGAVGGGAVGGDARGAFGAGGGGALGGGAGGAFGADGGGALAGGAGGALAGVACSAEECVEVARKPKKKKMGLVFGDGMATEAVAGGAAEAGARTVVAARAGVESEAGRG